MNIKLQNITKKYGNLTVLNDFNAEFEQNKITCLLGRSGSGKTTILNIISGITDYIGDISGKEGGISYIFQKERLLDNLTVYQNLEYVLKAAVDDSIERKLKIDEILKTVELYDKRESYPYSLSGGMQQRVSMARAFVYPTKLLLMDEPFRSLDIALKKRLIEAFLQLWKNYKRTVIFVTHDIDEALLLSDKIGILGGSPAVITDTFNISASQFDRKLTDKNMSDIRNTIYEIISV